MLLLLAPAAICSVALAAVNEARSHEFRSGVFDPPRAAPGFVLEGSDGAPVSLDRFLGKVVIVEFGFTHCVRVCPVTLGTLSQVFDALGGAAHDVQLIFVTVDPARDTPARLKEYLGFFNPTFVGGTVTRLAPDGSATALDDLRRAYGVEAARTPAQAEGGYDVHHSSSLHLIDARGRLRVLVPFGKPAADIVHDIQLLLKE
jgi:protein SCO1